MLGGLRVNVPIQSVMTYPRTKYNHLLSSAMAVIVVLVKMFTSISSVDSKSAFKLILYILWHANMQKNAQVGNAEQSR